MLVTGSNLEESLAAIELCQKFSKGEADSRNNPLYSTVGVHPCHATEIDDIEKHKMKPEEYIQKLEELAVDGKNRGIVKAFGEIGLDYDRLHYAPADVQRKYFKQQLDVATKVNLPLFLHSRACKDDFHSILSPYIEAGKLPKGGVVHSFTGTLDEVQDLLSLGLYIGINGCSLKTEENLKVVEAIPLNRIMLETDGPWCEIRPSHASYKKYLAASAPVAAQLLPYDAVKKEKFTPGAMVRGRCEPCSISLVAQVVAGIKGITLEELTDAIWENTHALFDI
ncbi:3'-5'-exodeoxyribonuclease [Sugiyamaella lignohabitans]|uniref:3'-5'-exodeoxyribonuclease n=1 Tax=Sugiyamaella lignohabitans TaxID=796027 RepID=A0A167DF94_9ASCO|nr:3'-5'-exodeoxyribonuclease [Sugiyamaella lignohabitans]ANB12851.1 3'-5'-exodeoxyribonuclease [Sugiyamaella lignohabitans]